MAVSFDTWAELQTAIEAWTTIDDTDAQVQEFISLAEDHFQLAVFTPDREAALSITADAQSEALPTDFWGFKSGPYIDAATDTVLTRIEAGDLRRTYPDATTGTPTYFAIEGENILFGPTPSTSFTVKGTYWQTIPALSSSATSNWLLLLHPRLYLYGALAEAFTFHMDEDRANRYLALRDEMILRIGNAGIRRASNSGPLVASHSRRHIRHIQA